MPLVLTTSTNPGSASWADASTLGIGYTVLQQRVQLADLPADTDTGVVTFGTVPANTIVIGGLIYLNTDVDVGASGITEVAVAFGAVDLGNLTDIVPISSDINLVGETNTPRYLSTNSDPTELRAGPGALVGAGDAYYQLTSTGADLDQLVAFDATFILILANLTLTVP